MRETYVLKNIRRPAPEVRAAVVAHALSRGITISDVIGETIAQAWDMEYELSGRRPVGIEADATQLSVQMPQEMAARIWMTSRTRGVTESSLVQELLAERFDVRFEPVRRGGWRRRRKRTAA